MITACVRLMCSHKQAEAVHATRMLPDLTHKTLKRSTSTPLMV